VGAALAASWFGVWGLYATYSWTAAPFLSSLQAARFYVPALGAISLLGAWLVAQVARHMAHQGRATLAAVTSAAVVVAMFGLGVRSFNDMRAFQLGGPGPVPARGPGPGPASGPGPVPAQP
jgi:hypothetical protein